MTHYAETYESPEQTCPSCGRVHRGERVDIRGRDGTIHWIGCAACFGALTRQLPIAFEMAQALRDIANSPALVPLAVVTEARYRLERWEAALAHFDGIGTTK